MQLYMIYFDYTGNLNSELSTPNRNLNRKPAPQSVTILNLDDRQWTGDIQGETLESSSVAELEVFSRWHRQRWNSWRFPIKGSSTTTGTVS